MGSEQEVVEANRGLWGLGVPDGVLRANGRRVEEGVRRHRVACEPKHVKRREVNGEAESRLSSVVENGLGVEGAAPTTHRNVSHARSLSH